MKRRAFKLCLFLLAGAIINVAVAWGFVLAQSLPRGRGATADKFLTRTEVWTVRRYDRFGLSYTESGLWKLLVKPEDTAPGPQELLRRESRLMNVQASRPNVQSQTEWEVIAGWPAFSMGGLKRNEFQPLTRDIEILHCAILLGPSRAGQLFNSSRDFHQKLLPLRPLWPGFAINTIFYAAIVWVLFAVPGAIRKRVRRKRGECATCGYSLRENVSEKCPECGAVVSTRSTA